MTPERWRQVDQVFQAAIELKAEERAAFVESACANDEELRREVESLITADKQGLSFVDEPAFQVAAGLLAMGELQLAEGQSIGHYEIVGPIGRGGMGEVYLAKDKLLNRRIALKLLPVDYTRNKDRLRRFQQEAQAASALNHPNILTIHELGEVYGQQFIATEFVEGETLRQCMKRGRLRLSEALDVTVQTAGALAAAHKAGIVHRDIKPENIMIRPDGYVKVLDFGLAKLTEQQERTTKAQAAENVNISSGLVMGTVKYMSPEQARGLAVDPRSDIFSFGVVFYEIIAGRPPFEGKTTSELVAAILKEDPPALNQFAPDAPSELQHIISRSLRKNKQDRYPAIQDLLVDLRNLRDKLELKTKLEHSRTLVSERGSENEGDLQTTIHTALESAVPTADLKPKHTLSSAEYLVTEIRRNKAWAAVALLFLSTVVIGYIVYKSSVTRQTASSKTLELTGLTPSGNVVDAAISPDGQYVAYSNGAGVWTRQLETNNQVQIIPRGTGSYWGLTFSPDGSHLYYFAKSDREPDALYRIPALGGVSTKLISDTSNSNGGDRVTFSPDGAHLAFVREYPSGETALIVANVDGTDERKLATRQSPAYLGSGAWSPDGKRIVCRGGYQENKTNRQELVEIEVEDGAVNRISTQEWFWIGDIAWVADGNCLLLTASERNGEAAQIWKIDYPAGTAHRISTDLDNYSGLSLTADSSVLVSVRGQMTMNIWIQAKGDLTGAKEITTRAAKDAMAGIEWTPDGRIVYGSNASGRPDIWIMDADGTRQKQLTFDMGTDRNGLSVSPDGRYVVFVSNRSGKNNIWRIEIDGSNPKQLTNGSGEFNPIFSPDGQWVEYNSSDSGQSVLWKVPVDGGGATQATWPYASVAPHPPAARGVSPDGRLMAYYIPPDDQTKVSRIGIASIDGSDPIRIFDLPPGVIFPQRIRWAPDGSGVTYIDKRGGVSNIWSQPLDRGPAQQLTDFKADFISNFAWSRDGKQLAIVRVIHNTDVVLMKNFK